MFYGLLTNFLWQCHSRIAVEALEAVTSVIDALGYSSVSQRLVSQIRPNVGSEVIPPI